MTTRCFIALGSNLDNPLLQLRSAVRQLRELPDSRLGACSPIYRNAAVGPGEQPDYLNAVVELHTTAPARQLLGRLQAIENSQGRRREQRWGARTLDLDCLLYGDRVIDEPDLQVPHPRMLERSFVLYPLLDIAPNLILPDGTALHDSCATCPDHDLVRLDDHLQE